MEDLSPLFHPQSLAIIGISRTTPSLGQMILDNLEQSNYTGNIYLVNPKADVIKTYKVYNQLKDLPNIDLAIILTPPKFVGHTLQQLGDKCKFVSIITAGFDDKVTDEILGIAQSAGIRIVGPNSMGTFAHQVSASFSPIPIASGNLGYISQSGSIIAVVQELMIGHFGFSKFISLGNKIDITEIDILPYLLQDSYTSVIAGYLESFSHPRKLREILLDITPKKPVILVKSGRTSEGSQAVTSHTGALAGNFRLTKSLLDYCGVISVPTIEQQIGLARYLDRLGASSPTGIVTISSAGGPGVLAADEIIEASLPLATLQQETIRKLDSVIPSFGNTTNPLDLVADAGIDRYVDTINIIRHDPNVSTIIVIIVHPVLIETEPLLMALNKLQLPIIICYLGPEYADFDHFDNLIVYQTTKEVIDILTSVKKYSHWKDNASQYLDLAHLSLQKKQDIPIDTPNVHDLLQAYGFVYPETFKTTDYTAAENWFKTQSSVVLKLLHPKFSHKTDSGGVILDITSLSDFESSWKTLQSIYDSSHIPEEERYIELQSFYSKGIEVVLGIIRDEQFGHFLLIGTGGTMVELLDDTIFLPSPVSRLAVKEALQSLRLHTLLSGYRGSVPIDIEQLIDQILLLDGIVQFHPQITELDINPLYILPESNEFIVLDARMTVERDN